MPTAGDAPHPLPLRALPFSEGEPTALGIAGLDTARMQAMREHLLRARPGSGNEALRVLRRAFPDAPLAERVRAAGEFGPAPY